MSKTRKRYSAQFKFDRILEAIKADNLSEISRKYGISLTVLSDWRREFLKRGAQMFASSQDQENKKLKAKIARLEQMIGKKEVELNVLKNFADFYESPDQT